MRGLVLKSTGSWYEVLTPDQVRHNCRVRGKIRLEGTKETNPIAVGDYVEFDEEMTGGYIHTILPRTNVVARQSVKKTGHSHIIAANIDQALLVVTLSFPRTSLGFIDRFLAAAESFRIPQALIFNKKDLLEPEELTEVTKLMKLYTSLGVVCQLTSANGDLSALRTLLDGKKTLVSGHSGVGKSTLLNAISKHVSQRVGDVSEFSSKGTHTTTFAEMFQLNDSTFVIDTPGIKELALVDMSPEEISDYFVEMREIRLQCKFGARCLHVNEPGCAVRAAVEAGQIAASRYANYVSILAGEDNRR